MIFAVETWKCSAKTSTRNTSTKKSKASSVQPRKPALTACHWPRFPSLGWDCWDELSMGPEILHGSHPGSPDPVERGYKLCHHEALMEQRRIISVIFLFIVVAIALLLYAQYNRPA